jgi:ribosomal protein S12 methylthiotransferase accessory factor
MSTRPLDPVPDSREFVSLRNDAPPLTAVLEACARHGIGVWFADMTREAIGIPAFRAIAPDLCHIKPRFARKRLLAPDPRDLSPVVPRPDEQVPLLM